MFALRKTLSLEILSLTNLDICDYHVISARISKQKLQSRIELNNDVKLITSFAALGITYN